MKTSSILMGLLIVSLSAWSQQQTTPVFAEVSWDKTDIDLGMVKYNKPVKAIFKFKNIGSIPVEVLGISRGSNCTLLQYPNKPVLPGETAIVEVEYDAAVIGFVMKTVRIRLNTKTPQTELNFTAEVVGDTVN